MTEPTHPVLDIRGLSVAYRGAIGDVLAVDDVDLTIGAGEMVGIAGESGSGKSTLVHAALRLLRPPGVVTGGAVRFGEPPVDLLQLPADELRRIRWSRIAVVFQSAMDALNPVLDVEAQLTDVVVAHMPGTDRAQRRRLAEEALDLVRVPRACLASYPHQLSGGMRQRVLLAMALILDPALVLFDEPTTALDPLVQREIVDEIVKLQATRRFAALFVTHDLPLLLDVADTIAVMYAGRLVERAATADLVAAPAHPYSAALLDAFPDLSGPVTRRRGLDGLPPDLSDLPGGCAFHPRCRWRLDRCTAEPPPVFATRTGVTDRMSRCWQLADGTAPEFRDGTRA